MAFRAEAHPGLEQFAVEAVLPQLDRLRIAIETDFREGVDVLTGAEKASIISELDLTTGKITVGTDKDYAFAEEFGRYYPNGTHTEGNHALENALHRNMGEVR
jgi:hypothetical protein